MVCEIWLRCTVREQKEPELASDTCHENNRKKRGKKCSLRGRTTDQIILSLLDKPSALIKVMCWNRFQPQTIDEPIKSFSTHSGTNHVALNQTPCLRFFLRRTASWSAPGYHSLTIMTSLPGSSLEPTEDSRVSILSTLQDVKKLLKEIGDTTHLLKEIEGNTHPGRGNRSVFRHKREEKVGFEISSLRDYSPNLFLDEQSHLPKKKRGAKWPHYVLITSLYYNVNHFPLECITFETNTQEHYFMVGCRSDISKWRVFVAK